jgi:squalene-hopene/tetraprenyl-beta-curcumene cyclase
MVDNRRLLTAYATARDRLRNERIEGHWVGELSASALSTATAVSALALVDRALDGKEPVASESRRVRASLRRRGVDWLLQHQNPDGGWGDTDRSYSNVSTSMLVLAALHLDGDAQRHPDVCARARGYLDERGGVSSIRARYGKDKTFAVPILTNAALAGLVPWREVSALPFEAACLPQSFYRFLRLPVVSYAIPALVAIGQAKYHHDPPWDPLRRVMRRAAIEPSLRVLARMQPHSGGYLEAVPLTSFVLMSLASTGRVEHEVSCGALRFIEASVRPDGSWPIDTNLATWNTSLAINALAADGDLEDVNCLDWLLSCQHRIRHPFTGAEPGGWGWSDLSGAVPDADDTPGALLALASLLRGSVAAQASRAEIQSAVLSGARWLLNLQNSDGGWPTFCRGWGKLPFDRSGADLTAHAIRALHAWRDILPVAASAAIERGFRYLGRQQREDGSWVPLWFGNQDVPAEENPVYGTAKVLKAFCDCDRRHDASARRAAAWLAGVQNSDGGWGGGAAGSSPGRPRSSVEETSLAVESLLPFDETLPRGPFDKGPVERGLEWLVESVESGRFADSTPIGFYFAKLWYYERLYPVVFAVSALGHAVRYRGAAASRSDSGLEPVAHAVANAVTHATDDGA